MKRTRTTMLRLALTSALAICALGTYSLTRAQGPVRLPQLIFGDPPRALPNTPIDPKVPTLLPPVLPTETANRTQQRDMVAPLPSISYPLNKGAYGGPQSPQFGPQFRTATLQDPRLPGGGPTLQNANGGPVFRQALLTPQVTPAEEEASKKEAEADPRYQESNEYQELPTHAPWTASDAHFVPFDPTVFSSGPQYDHITYEPWQEIDVYQGRTPLATQRPWVELGRGLYLEGEIPPSSECLGPTNLLAPHLLVYGDLRLGAAYIDSGNRQFANAAVRLNLDIDLKITDTERVHAFIGPVDQNGSFTRYQFENGSGTFVNEFDADFDTVYFEGDVGSIFGGICGCETPFDMPFTVGLFPWLTQNGVWFNDAVLGTAVTIPARNNRFLDISNFDITFFTVFDELTSPAFNARDNVFAYGTAGFFEMQDGYIETGYAYLDNNSNANLSYHNMSIGYTRRIQDIASTSFRAIVNTGQSGPVKTADGQLFIFESSLITSKPSTFVPYMNAFVGFGRPQSVARAGGTGGVLNNTGIVFETDGLNGTPTLDATANDTYGGAIGLNWLADDFSHQLIMELGTVQTHGDGRNRNARGRQYGAGVRYQRPLNHAWIIRFDALHGLREGQSSISAFRSELRWKF